MSNNHNNRMENAPLDWEAARDLVENDELLRDDPYTLSVLDKRGVVGEGEDAIRDIGTFLDARRRILEGEREKSHAAADVEDAMAVHSTPEDNNL